MEDLFLKSASGLLPIEGFMVINTHLKRGFIPPLPLCQFQMKNMHPDNNLSRKMEELCSLADKNDVTGMITYLGVFSSGGRQSNWIRNEVSTDDLLLLIEDNTVEKVLNSIGNSDKLAFY